MEILSAEAASERWDELLDGISQKHLTVITQAGVPAAKLVAIAPKSDLREVIARMREFRKGHTLNGISIRELIEEGRRY